MSYFKIAPEPAQSADYTEKTIPEPQVPFEEWSSTDHLGEVDDLLTQGEDDGVERNGLRVIKT